MGRLGRRGRMGLAVAGAVTLLAGVAGPALAFHLYRNLGNGCTPATGSITDDTATSGPVAATVLVMHNTFNDTSTGLPVTHIKAGQSVLWKWASEHCHSVQQKAVGTALATGFYSGFHYPLAVPTTPKAVPGLVLYPVPDIGDQVPALNGVAGIGSPTLSYTHTFTTPGTYTYICEHHVEIGMVGTVVVDAL